MATDLHDISGIATWPTFQQRVQAAMVTAAVDVGHEAEPTDNYTSWRRSLVQKVFEDPQHWRMQFSWAVAANPSITYESTDSDIQWTVNSVWDALAGASKPAAADETTTPTA
jgi:hypothetical protein